MPQSQHLVLDIVVKLGALLNDVLGIVLSILHLIITSLYLEILLVDLAK